MHTKYIDVIHKDISRIGLGCVTFGREIGRKESLAVLDYAAEMGITHLDTAASYGNGASELILGEWLSCNQKLTKSFIIASKVQPPYSSDAIIRSVTSSLARLNVSSIDIIYLHQWDASINSIEVLKTLMMLIHDGIVKMLGVSNFSASQLQQALRMQKENQIQTFGCIQNNNNFAIRDISPELLELCRSQGMYVVTYSPLGAGFLSGKHQNGVVEGSRFAVIPEHSRIYFQEYSNGQLQELLSISKRSNLAPAHLALSWAFQQEGVSSVLVGARSISHIDQALYSLAHPFPGFDVA